MKFFKFTTAVFICYFVFNECLAKRDLSRDRQMEHALHLVEKWNYFKEHYNKSYSTLDEELTRMTIFILNMIKVERLNQKHDADPKTNLKLYCNKFGDLTHVEYQKNILMSDQVINKKKKNTRDEKIKLTSSLTVAKHQTIPSSLDWRKFGVVTPVKNQKFCASCYAFVTTGAIEAQVAMKTGQLISLSEQQIMDCSISYGNMGCNMGAIDLSFDYIQDNGGIVADSSYPYEAETSSCRAGRRKRIATISNYINLENGDEELLKKVVATMGPVSVNIDASNINFMFYQGGILIDHTCSQQDFNHGVLEGYIRIARNQNNMCGIASAPTIPVIKNHNIFLPKAESGELKNKK